MSPHEPVDRLGEMQLGEMQPGAAELYGLFERRRPQPEAFRAGIEERIAARRAQSAAEQDSDEDGDGHGGPVRSSFWRRVAALLPLGPLDSALAGKTLGGKVLSSALALPALMLASVFGGFLAGARSVRRTSAGALPVDASTRKWAMTHGRRDRVLRFGGLLAGLVQFGTIAALLATWLLGGTIAVDVLTLVLVISMAALVVMVRAYARVGLLEREDVTRLGMGILLSVFLGCFLWFNNLHIADDPSSLGIGWPSTVVLLGVVACFAVAGQWARAGLASAFVLVAIVGLNTPGVTHTSQASLRSQLEHMDLDPGSLRAWDEAAALHQALAAVGAELPELGRTRERLTRALAEGVDIHPTVWTSAFRMGLVDDVLWSELAQRGLEPHQLDGLQERGRANRTTYYEYLYPMLLATRVVMPDERERMAQEILAHWPEVGDHGALDEAVASVEELDLLGRADLVEGLRERVHELLRAYWVSGRGSGLFDNVGGFTSDPAELHTSFATDTLRGVELMARFGVPEGIDLGLLHSHLRRESWSIPLPYDPMPYLKAESRAALLRLREQIGLPERTWIQAVLGERLLIGTLLIVLLCLIAIRLAPPLVGLQPAGDGAQP